MDAEHLSCGPSELRSVVLTAHQISKASCAKKSGSCFTDHFHIDYISKHMHQIMYQECFGEIGLNKILKLTPPLVPVVVLVAQSCPTLCDPLDGSPPSSVHGILQARILEWVTMSSPRGTSRPRESNPRLLSPASGVDCLPLSHQGIPFYYFIFIYSLPFSKENS